ncbi:hypothetical protein TPR58_14180 [Sphingomonas sp. HF-S3]|uniref:DUF4142 domain-containing protein n=1 Tax=Sphingomonas rustica TaxID=3103142 RepID=A0ABV0BAX0_9SPHN
MRHAVFPLLALALAGCSDTGRTYPSLLPRPIEGVGIAEPKRTVPVAETDAALDKRISELVGTLEAQQRAFSTLAGETEAKVAVASGLPRGSDRWLDAQTALTQLSGTRGSVTDTLLALEGLASERGMAGKVPYPALDAAVGRASQVDAQQAARLRSLESALGTP